MSDRATKRRSRAGGSQTSLGVNMNDELEMAEKTRPSSSHSRNAWSEEDILNGPGSDDVDFSPRAPASAAVDVPSAMEAELVSHERQVTTDVRAPGTKNVPVGCWTRFKRIIRSKFVFNKTALISFYKSYRHCCMLLSKEAQD